MTAASREAVAARRAGGESFSYIWQYRVRDGQRSAFLEAYRPGGAWTILFSRDSSYVGTELLRDADQPDRYLTIDTWLSRSACDAFRERYAEEFAALDRRCEAFTVQEEFIGDFCPVAGAIAGGPKLG